ncbi:MAG: hypothetical protein ACE5H7_12965 [Acidiferrobacterales bacterium]
MEASFLRVGISVLHAIQSETFNNVVAGLYTVTEDDPTPNVLSTLSCDDDNSTGDVPTGTATIDLEAGETVTCSFTKLW